MTYQTPTSTTGQTIASSITYNPHGKVKCLTFGRNYVETFIRGTDNRITGVKVQPPDANAAIVDLALTWMAIR